MAAVQAAIRQRLPDPAMLDFVATTELRTLSLRIFDRSFAVTYYLQAVAIAIGLVGIGASLSAQVLARRKEFGLLAHLGLTKRQVLAVVAGEGAAWLAAGTVIGLAAGAGGQRGAGARGQPAELPLDDGPVAAWGRLAALCAAVMLTGTATAAFAARRALSRSAVLAVKEDW
jgi:putative ABC transport system permease protein